MIKYLAYSSVGKKRETNGDRAFVNGNVISSGTLAGNSCIEIVAGVCDGVGSTQGGELAAEMVASSFKEYIVPETSALSLNKHLHRVNRDILLKQKSNPEFQNMATTIAGVILYQNRYLLFHLGDTRVYYVNNGKLTLKTKDHTVTNTKVAMESELDNNQEDALTRYIGGKGYNCKPSIQKGIISDNTVSFFICSDGIHKSIQEDGIKEALTCNKEIEEKKEAILKCLLQNGSSDDMSFVIIDYVA